MVARAQEIRGTKSKILHAVALLFSVGLAGCNQRGASDVRDVSDSPISSVSVEAPPRTMTIRRG